MDASFRVEHIINIIGHESTIGTIDNPPPQPDVSQFGLLLPDTIEIEPVLREDVVTNTTYWDFTVILHKETFPHYQKRMIIIDKTPEISDLTKKLYEIRVIVYWALNDGTVKSITITGEESYVRSSS